MAYKLGADLNTDQEEAIHKLFQDYEDILTISFDNIKGNTPFTHHVDTGSEAPIKQRPYIVPVKYKAWVKKELEILVESGLIVPSHSPWGSPIVIVPKKTTEGTFTPRMCIDY